MSAKRWFVDKTHDDSRTTTQVGGGSKTPDKATELRQRMRAQQPRGGSASFTVREGRK